MQEINLDESLNESIFALIYGASGSGKTHLIGTLGELGTVLVIDVDKGSKTLASAKDLQAYRDNFTVVSFDKFKDLDDAYKHVKENNSTKWSKTLGIEITKPFDWIVWDTWSELQWHMLQELRKTNGLTGVGLDFRKGIQIQHWGMMTDLNKLAIESFRDCNVNQIFTMQETMTKDELSGQITGGPAIHGKMVQEMPSYFDVVIRTYCDIQGNYCATTKRKGNWPAKTRLKEGTEYKNPTAKQIFS